MKNTNLDVKLTDATRIAPHGVACGILFIYMFIYMTIPWMVREWHWMMYYIGEKQFFSKRVENDLIIFMGIMS